MTKQSSEYNGAPMVRLYRLDCHATLAMNPSEAQDAARTPVRRRHIFKFYILKLHHFITLSLYH